VESPAAAVVAPASADLACGTAKLQGDVAGTPNANGSPRKDRSSGIVGRALFRRGQRLRSPGCATPKTSPAWWGTGGWSPILRWSLDPGSIGRRTETSGPARARPTTRTPRTSTDIPSEDRATIQRRSRGRAGHGPARWWTGSWRGGHRGSMRTLGPRSVVSADAAP